MNKVSAPGASYSVENCVFPFRCGDFGEQEERMWRIILKYKGRLLVLIKDEKGIKMSPFSTLVYPRLGLAVHQAAP